MNQDPFLTKRKGIVGYLARVFVAIDQLLNALTGGDEDETLSSRLGKDARRGRFVGCVLCKVLGWIDKDHCEKAIERDEGKRPGQYDPPK
jgi:hypothetical protein